MAFSPDGRTCSTGSEDGTARLWDAATGQPLGQPLLHQAEVTAAAFSPDGRPCSPRARTMTARLWERRPRIGAFDGPWAMTRASSSQSAFSPDGRTVLTASEDGTARLWDAATGRAPRTAPRASGRDPWPWRSAPTARPSLTGSEDETARLWDAATGQPLGPPLRARGAVHAVAFSPDGRTVLTGERGRDGAALGRGHRPARRPTADDIEAAVRGVAFSPDGRPS